MMRSIGIVALVLLFAVGTAEIQAQTKKATAPAPAKKAAPEKKTTTAAPAKKAAAKKTTTKSKTAKAAAAKSADSVKTAVQPTPDTTTKEAAKTDTASDPSLKDYAKSKVNEAAAAKDTLVNSGAEKLNRAKENIGNKLKNFDPFKKTKTDTAKTK